ncbi:hypothetical protein ACVWZ6_004610 [Bradyrhizobium sp. GM6.1]
MMLLVSRRAFVIMMAAIDVPPGTGRTGIDDLWSYAGDHNSSRAVAAAGATESAISFPDDTNTGVVDKARLKASGPIITSEDEQIIRELDISGTVQINHNAVRIENCRITAAAFSVVTVADGVTGAVVQNCEINGVGSGNDGSCGISGHGTFTGNNIYNVENGFSLAGNATIIENNYIHDLKASGAPHYDGIQIDGNVSEVTITHNTIINNHNQTSAVMIDNWAGPISDIVVDSNRLIGGAYTVYSDGRLGTGRISNVSFTNNRMGRGLYGYRAFSRNAATWKGNLDDASGRPI